MRNLINKRRFEFGSFFSGVMLALVFLNTSIVGAVTSYPYGALLQPNDVTTIHIRNSTILGQDINPIAEPQITSLRIGTSTLNGDLTLWNSGTTTQKLFTATNGASTTLFTILANGNIGIASSTPNYALTVNGTTSLTRNIRINDVAYTLPSADGADGTVLKTNGAGTLTWGGASAFLAGTTTNQSITSSAVETTFATISIPGGTFSTNKGIKFTIVMSNSRTGYGGAETHRIKYGGTTIWTTTDDPAGTPSEGPTYVYTGYIMANNATNAQELSMAVNQNGASALVNAFTGQGTSAIDSTTAQDLVITGQCADGIPQCTVSLLSYLIEKI